MELFLGYLLGTLTGASLATCYWLYRLYRGADFRVKHLERALWEAQPEFASGSDLGMDE